MQSPLPAPSHYKQEFSLTADLEANIAAYRNQIAESLQPSSPSFLVILGPCSIDNLDAAIEYAERLQTLQAQVSPQVLLVMRTYVEKPRTTIGWTGFINDPRCSDERNPAEGIKQTRQLLLKLCQMGVPCASELLNPVLTPYYSDLLAYASIGARTSESQLHRQLAASLPMPVGIKNPTAGDLTVAAHSVHTAMQAQSFLSLNDDGKLIPTQAPGNPNAHLILRGSRSHSNHHLASITLAAEQLKRYQSPSRLVIDCSHGNSEGCHLQQENVARQVFEQVSKTPYIAGVMLESYLQGGKQTINQQPREYGKSITDACLSWEVTEQLVHELSEKLTKHSATGLNVCR